MTPFFFSFDTSLAEFMVTAEETDAVETGVGGTGTFRASVHINNRLVRLSWLN